VNDTITQLLTLVFENTLMVMLKWKWVMP